MRTRLLEAIGAGLAANPQVEPLLDAESSPGFRLRWSPPFLWRAFPIDYCVVSIIRTNHSDSVHYGKNIKMIAELNTTFSESGIMSLHFNECNDDQQSQSCVVMMFVIMAFNSKDGFHSKSVSAIGRYPSGLDNNSNLLHLPIVLICADVGNFSESAISTVTMVSSNAFSQNLLVRIQIKVCLVTYCIKCRITYCCRPIQTCSYHHYVAIRK